MGGAVSPEGAGLLSAPGSCCCRLRTPCVRPPPTRLPPSGRGRRRSLGDLRRHGWRVALLRAGAARWGGPVPTGVCRRSQRGRVRTERLHPLLETEQALVARGAHVRQCCGPRACRGALCSFPGATASQALSAHITPACRFLASGARINGKHRAVAVQCRRIVESALVRCGMIRCAHLLLAGPAQEADASRGGPGAAKAAVQQLPILCTGLLVRCRAEGRPGHRGEHERGREARCGVARLLSAAAWAGCAWPRAGGAWGASPWKVG